VCACVACPQSRIAVLASHALILKVWRHDKRGRVIAVIADGVPLRAVGLQVQLAPTVRPRGARARSGGEEVCGWRRVVLDQRLEHVTRRIRGAPTVGAARDELRLIHREGREREACEATGRGVEVCAWSPVLVLGSCASGRFVRRVLRTAELALSTVRVQAGTAEVPITCIARGYRCVEGRGRERGTRSEAQEAEWSGHLAVMRLRGLDRDVVARLEGLYREKRCEAEQHIFLFLFSAKLSDKTRRMRWSPRKEAFLQASQNVFFRSCKARRVSAKRTRTTATQPLCPTGGRPGPEAPGRAAPALAGTPWAMPCLQACLQAWLGVRYGTQTDSAPPAGDKVHGSLTDKPITRVHVPTQGKCKSCK
jgi:hypothetical protein